MVEFWVAGVPVPQGSKTGFVNPKSGRVVMVESAKGLKFWRESVAVAAREFVGADWVLLDQPLRAVFEFYLPAPKSSKWKLRPAGKPDSSKLLRAVEDALTGVVYRDDSLLVDSWASKFWADDRGPGCLVKITVL